MSRLERRYRSLLKAYPERYRDERGDEIVGTLLEAARSEQHWPTSREAAGLILGGLRTRTGANLLAGRPVWRDALHLAAVLAAVWLTWQVVSVYGRVIGGWAAIVWVVVLVGLVLAVCTGRYRVALVLLGLDTAVAIFGSPFAFMFPLEASWLMQERVVLFGAVGVLAWRRHERPPAAFVIAGLALVVPFRMLLWTMAVHGPSVVWILLVTAAPVVLALLGAVVDGRLAMGFGLSVLGYALPLAASVATGLFAAGEVLVMAGLLTFAGGSVIGGWLYTQRQARV